MFNGTNVSVLVPVLYTLAVFFLRQHLGDPYHPNRPWTPCWYYVSRLVVVNGKSFLSLF